MRAIGLVFTLCVTQLCIAAFAKQRGCPTGTSNYTYAGLPLPLPYDGYLPVIDNDTMFLHFNRHAGASINNVNTILARYPALQEVSLAELVKRIGVRGFDEQYNISAADSAALRNNAGSAYNHAIFWRIMTSFNTSTPAALKPELAALITTTWGSPTGMLDALRAAGSSVFGSGWAWVILRSNGTLAIVTTPNQDNPVMRRHVPVASRGVPLLGVDVWEHAYYLKYRNVRASYLANWVYLVDWARLQVNYDLAKKDQINSLYC